MYRKIVFLPRKPKQGYTIPLVHKKLADEGKLTVEILLKMEYTEMLRFATYPPAAEFIFRNIGVRGLPLKEPYNLFPHQITSLQWMKERELKPHYGIRGGILSLKQGLGKSLNALAHILISPKGEFPTLIISSLSVMHEWRSQGVEKFFGSSVKVLFYHKIFLNKNIYDNIDRETLIKYDIVFTTYDVCVQATKEKMYHEETYEFGEEGTMWVGKVLAVHCRTLNQVDKPHVKGHGILYCTPWERVICDESQKFANPSTKVYKCMMALYGKYKWCLTGTPIRNYDCDIWAQLRFCGYVGITKAIEWKRGGLRTFKNHNLEICIFTMDYIDAKVEIPPKEERNEPVELTGNHKIFYDWMLGETVIAYDEMMKGHCSFASILAMLTRLRQCAIAPYLTTSQSKRIKNATERKYQEAMDKKIKERFQNSEMYQWLCNKETDSGIESSKVREIVDILRNIPKGEKVLVFSMFTSCLDLLVDAVKKHIPDFTYEQFDGDVKGLDRPAVIERFRNDKDLRCLFLNYKVGSEGLNLTEANHCICIEPWWTNAVHNQAKSRCWRSGQTKPVIVYNVLSNNTIEGKIMEICRAKDVLASSYLEGTEKPLGRVGLNKFTLGKILGIF